MSKRKRAYIPDDEPSQSAAIWKTLIRKYRTLITSPKFNCESYHMDGMGNGAIFCSIVSYYLNPISFFSILFLVCSRQVRFELVDPLVVLTDMFCFEQVLLDYCQ